MEVGCLLLTRALEHSIVSAFRALISYPLSVLDFLVYLLIVNLKWFLTITKAMGMDEGYSSVCTPVELLSMVNPVTSTTDSLETEECWLLYFLNESV